MQEQKRVLDKNLYYGYKAYIEYDFKQGKKTIKNAVIYGKTC
jgi:hypothetical protein